MAITVKIDLEKELGIDQAALRKPPPLLYAVAALAVAALLLAGAALVLARRVPTPVPAPPLMPSDLGIDTQASVRTEARIRSVERSIHDLRSMVTEYKMSMKELVAQQQIAARRERMHAHRSNATLVATAATRDAAYALSPASIAVPVLLSDEEKRVVDALADRDESGAQLREFVRAVTNAPRQNAYVRYLLEKADAWLASAIKMADDNSDFELYADNSLYFYDAVADVSLDNGVIAFAEAKRSLIRSERQRRDTRLSAHQENERLKEQLKVLEQRLKQQEDRELKKNHPPPPPVKRVYKP